MKFNVVHKHSGEVYPIFSIKMLAGAQTAFLVYDEAEGWCWVNAKAYKPHKPKEEAKEWRA